MDDVQAQARALGAPTRHRIFEYLAAAGGPVGIAELAEHLDVHHNAVRQHLAKLVGAGLVQEETAAPSGRGRPRLLYRVDPAGAGRWSELAPFERLALLLVEVIRTGLHPEEVGRRAGIRLTAGTTVDDPVEELATRMAELGFRPRTDRDEAEGRVEITLETCPFTSAVKGDAETVCGLHLGLARGIAEEAGGLRVEELVLHDPVTAGCRLRCRSAA